MRPTLILAVALALVAWPASAQTPDPCAPTPVPPTATATASPTAVPPSPTPSPTPGPVNLPVIVVYSGGWGPGWGLTTPGGWRGSYTVSRIVEGANLQVDYGGYGGLQLYSIPARAVPAGSALAFTLSGDGRVRVTARHGGGTASLGTVGAGNVRLSLPAMNALAELAFQNDEGAARTLFFTDIRIEGGGATPAGLAPTASPSPAPTRSPTAVPAGGALRILPLGDSITEGVNGGYRPNLRAALEAAGRPVTYVGPRSDVGGAHAGTPGFNTGDILRELPGYLSTYRPTVVLLMIGTNDLAWWTADQNVAASTAARVDTIIDRIQASGAQVYLATIPPASSASVPIINRDRAALVRAYNAELRALAAARGVPLVDVEAALTLSDLYDGIHPSEAAHDNKIAPAWAEAILGQ